MGFKTKFYPSIIAAVVVFTEAGCRNGPNDIEGFSPTHESVVKGRVISASGSPLDEVAVGVLPNESAGYGYAVLSVVTNNNGEFTYRVRRMSAPTNVPSPDTVTATIRAMGLDPSYDRNGQKTIGETKAVLTFLPFGTPSAVTTVEIVLNIP